MKILLIAPHPFFQERGTPIAVDLLIRALTEHGYTIDLITFNEGIDVEHKGLTIHRVKPFPEIKGVMPGFSGKKILLDILVFFKFIALMIKNRYRVVHAVEESAFMATLVCPLFRTPFIYDMDSSMATQIIDKMTFLKPLEKLIRLIESVPMRRANIVIPVCQALADEVIKYRSQGIHILKDVSLANKDTKPDEDIMNIRKEYKVTGNIFMYIGNLESYQGIDLMIDAFKLHLQAEPEARLAIIGGSDSDITKYQQKSELLEIANEVLFLGRQPISQINDFMIQSDVLMSPRVHGVNTAMKVYSYLDSGVAVLATNLPTHTQVVNETQCKLANPDPDSFAQGMEELSNAPALRKSLAASARILIEKEHSYPAFKENLYQIYNELP